MSSINYQAVNESEMAGYKSSKQLYDENRNYINKQDDILDDIIDTAHVATNTGKEINNTLKVQDKMLDKLGNKTDNNVTHMKKTNSKLDDLLEKQSYCRMYMIIFIEIVVLVMILLYL